MSHHYQSLIDSLEKEGYLKTPEIIAAFRHIKRNDFVLQGLEHESHYNFPLLIGYGQTISQPATVAFMLELLRPQVGEKILDVGAGSGWQTTLLAQLVGRYGQIIALERIPELVDFATKNIAKYHLDNVELIMTNGFDGYAKFEPYDGIIVAAAAPVMPQPMLAQLKVGGRMVIPIGEDKQDIYLIKRADEKTFKYQKFPGFLFVPLVPEKN
jgi:protein-L-isoaspartate(D-aspartate) O-methyltransferase